MPGGGVIAKDYNKLKKENHSIKKHLCEKSLEKDKLKVPIK